MTRSESETLALGRRIGRRLEPGAILLLAGALGAGKTILAKGIAAGLGVAEVVTSPTYTIVSEYEGRLRLHHIDLYRISGEEEFLQLGVEESIYSDGVSLIEWPERAAGALSSDATTIEIRIDDDGTRSVTGPSSLLGEENAHESSVH
ncbi:MAG TPA: tRNA (adenosine(37)-N6)-threonylcarbamoyltransferase complex ATPase subunit type 1 TsaE [Spirochaetia bacterium]|nr:tRNA (adenosine(37)-N6)-threonylcarbamoyltransferase complex ATPase subunit type 1 TsaE [Spirochaetia bacterium]